MRRKRRSAWNGAPVLAVLVVLSSAVATDGAEPVGAAVVDASWADREGDGPQSRTVRVAVRPLVPIENWELVVSMPLGFDAHLREAPAGIEFRNVPSTDRRILHAEMERLGKGAVLTLEFEVLFPPSEGGTIAFVAESAEGTVLGGTGITARPSGPPATRRLGAVEYPARVVADPEQR